MLVVMMPGEKKHYTANQHESSQNRFPVMLQSVLEAIRLRAQQEGYAQQHISNQLTQYEHQAVHQHTPFVVYLAVDITDGGNARE